MLEKLDKIQAEYKDIINQLSDPNIAVNPKEYIRLNKRKSALEPLFEVCEKIEKYNQQKAEALILLKDPDMKELAQEEFQQAKDELVKLEEELKILLLPKDKNDDKNIIIELRQAAGGEEAALFAAELGRAYLRYAENLGFQTEILHWQEAESGGLKEGSIEIMGDQAYAQFKYESGVHRVQRIPATESQGRIHTSTCTVAVMPEVDDEIAIDIKEEDIRIDTYRAQGAGGQHVNKTDSAIRITHLPTGIVVACQDQRSQHRNKDKAFTILKAKLYEEEQQKRHKESADTRSSQVGNGDRSEKIRTYNFPQDRMTDHRIKQSWSNLPGIMNGYFNDIVEKITLEDQARKMAMIE